MNWLGGNAARSVLGLVYGYIPYLILVLYAGLDRIEPALLEAGRDLGLGRARTFRARDAAAARQPILTGLLITVLPMLGDYYTNQMLSGAASTSMIGNLIQGQLGTPGLEGQGAVLSLMLLLVLLIPMIYYVIATEPGGDPMTATKAPRRAARRPPPPPRPRAADTAARAFWRNPWRHPCSSRGSPGSTWSGRWSRSSSPCCSRSTTASHRAPGRGSPGAGTSATRSTPCCTTRTLHAAVIQTVRLSVLTTVIAVPLGVAFALGINRWRGPVPATFNFVMILSYVIPELIFGVSMFFVFTTLFSSVHLGTAGRGPRPGHLERVAGRRSSSRPGWSPSAASTRRRPPTWAPTSSRSMRRVMVPLLAPAIFASAVLVFSGVIDDFVIVDLLSSSAGNTPMSVIIYSTQHGGNGGPALNALGSIMLVMSLIIVILGYAGYRLLTRGERGGGLAALTAISGES